MKNDNNQLSETVKKEEVIILPKELKEVLKSSNLTDLTKAEKIAINYAPLFTQIGVQSEKLKQLKKGVDGHGELAKRISIDLGHIAQDAVRQKKIDKEYIQLETRLIDSLYNSVNGAARLTQSEAKEIADYEENIKREKREKLISERSNELIKYDVMLIPAGLGDMEQEVYDIFLNGAKNTFESKKEAERKAEELRIEEEKKEKLYHSRKEELFKYKAFCNITLLELETTEEEFDSMLLDAIKANKKHDDEQAKIERKRVVYVERKEKLLPLYQFTKMDQLTPETSEEEFLELLSDANSKKETYDTEQEKIRIENERLKKEANEREAKAEQERKRVAKERSDREEKEAEAQRVRNEELAKERAKIKRLEDEEKERQIAAERKAKAEADAKRAAALAPDKVKLLTLIEKLEIELPDLSNEDSKSVGGDLVLKFQSYKTWAIGEIERLK